MIASNKYLVSRMTLAVCLVLLGFGYVASTGAVVGINTSLCQNLSIVLDCDADNNCVNQTVCADGASQCIFEIQDFGGSLRIPVEISHCGNDITGLQTACDTGIVFKHFNCKWMVNSSTCFCFLPAMNQTDIMV